MALIQCAECGKQISDKASACPACGAPVQAAVGLRCHECGQALPAGRATCPGCGAPVAPTAAPHPSTETPGWYLANEGSPTIGPLQTDQVVRGRLAGKIPAGTQIRFANDPRWFQLDQVPEIANATAYAAGQASAARQPPPAPTAPRKPTRSFPAAALAVGIGFVLMVVNGALLGAAAFGLMFVLLLGCVVGAVLLMVKESLRTRSLGELAALATQRRVAMGIVIAVVGLMQAGALGIALPDELARRRLDAALESSDPCSVEGNADRPRATEAQQGRLEERDAACKGKREKEATQLREKRCEAAAAALLNGSMPGDAIDLLGIRVDLCRRIAGRNVSLHDFESISNGDMPCTDTTAQSKFWAAYIKAVVASSGPWGLVTGSPSFSAGLLKEIEGGTVTLTADSAKALTDHVEQLAGKALEHPKSAADLDDAVMLCGLQKPLKIQVSPNCAYATAKREAMKKQEEAASSAKSSRCEAQSAGHADCLERCDRRYGADFDCEGACDRRNPTPDCQ